MNIPMNNMELSEPRGGRDTLWGRSASRRLCNGDRRPEGQIPLEEHMSMPNTTDEMEMDLSHRRCKKPGSLSDYALAMVYTPEQEFVEVYDPMTALSRGTMFSELDKPWLGSGGSCGGGSSCGRRGACGNDSACGRGGRMP